MNGSPVSAAEPLRLQFRPRARLIRTIGDRLISGPEAAAIELVKNSHDADASYVRVTFLPPLERDHGRIVVEDDGHGMTLSAVQDKWMEPATADKIERKRSPNGRVLLGSKGIGRFAAAKLGRYLSMLTVADLEDRSYETTLVPEIDWDEFTESKYLSDVSFVVDVDHAATGASGTRLEIWSLRDNWTEKSVRALHQEMRRLISPLDEDDSTFKIYLDLSACTIETSGFDGDSIVNSSLPTDSEVTDRHRVRPFPILKGCDYEVVGSFEDVPSQLSPGKIVTRFLGSMTIHRGDQVPEPIDLEFPARPDLGEETFGAVLVHLFIFDREAAALKGAMSRAGYGSLSAQRAREMLDNMAGVAIYRDKFRIRPYGDREKDWLTLDARRVQYPTLRIGHNQVSGIVVVGTEEESGLIEQSSREGLEFNGSFQRLQRLVLDLFAQAIEPRREAFREGAELGRTEADTFSQALKSAQFNWASKLIEKAPEQVRPELTQLVADEADKLGRYLRKLQEKQASLEAKVTLGLIIGEVLHEGRAPVSVIQQQASRLSRWWKTIFDSTDEAESNRREIPSVLRLLANSAERLRSLFRALEPLSGAKRGQPRLYSPRQVVLDVVQLLDQRIRAGGVDVSCTSSSEDDLLGHPEDLATAITNVMDNALYWLDYHQIDKPTIAVALSKNKNNWSIDISDNGPGIPTEFRDRIFDVGFTLKPSGTGLGLNIALESVGRSNGNIELVDSDRGAHFRLSLPLMS